MPLRKHDDTHDDESKDGKPVASQPFPPEAHAYDSDITDEVTKRVQAEADKVLSKDTWVVIDGVDKR